MNINQRINQKLEHGLLQGFDLQMMQNLYILPGIRFSEYVDEYCRENPALQLKNRKTFSVDTNYALIAKEKTLYDHLTFQIEVSFDDSEKQEAIQIAASLDDNGFFHGEDSIVLKKMHYLDPIGIATSSVRECLMVQLKDQNKTNTTAYIILDKYYKDFLLQNTEKLSKNLQVCLSNIKEGFDQIRKLNPFPGRGFQSFTSQHVYPELKLTFNKIWKLEFNSSIYQSVGLVKKGTPKQILDAKRFIYQLHQRKQRLEWIVSKIVKKQENFLLSKGEKNSMYRQELLKDLDISESTLSRILSEKYIQTPIGIFPLSYFFNKRTTNISEDSSVEKAKQLLINIIENENKKKPYTDDKLKELLQQQGIICSRRSIAKYRKKLSIPGAYHRVFR